MRTIAVMTGPLLVLAACAASPESIAPAYVSPMAYHSWNCEQLAAEGHRLVSANANVAAQQNQARTGDTVGVILVGLPISSMTGQNVAPEVARLKGEHEAVYRAAIEKGCTVQGAGSQLTTASIPSKR